MVPGLCADAAAKCPDAPVNRLQASGRRVIFATGSLGVGFGVARAALGQKVRQHGHEHIASTG